MFVSPALQRGDSVPLDLKSRRGGATREPTPPSLRIPLHKRRVMLIARRARLNILAGRESHHRHRPR